MPSAQLRLLLFLAVVLGFAAWAMGLTWSVRTLRGQVEEQVGWLVATSAWERAPGPGEASDTIAELLPAMRARLGTTPEASERLDAVETALASRDAAAQRQAAQQLSSLIRRANAALSADLGDRWDQVTVLVFVAIAFAFAAVLLQALRLQDQEARATTERARRAAEDRLARVGVGLLCIDDDNRVHAANEVAKGLAATRSSVEAWWQHLDDNMRRPGTVPCKLCAKPVPLGRCEVTDTTRMGQRTVEVVFGGHAHDLEHGDKLVVLVRDITEQRRRLLSGGAAARLTDGQDLARSVACALADRSERLAQSLTALAEQHDDLDEPISLAGDLCRIGRSVALLADDGQGPCDIGEACQAAADLVRPQLAPQVELRLDLPPGLQGHVRRGRFAQALFAELLAAAEACVDGSPHTIHLGVATDGANMLVEIQDDRDPDRTSSRRSASGSEALFQAAGARIERRQTLDRHVTTIRAAAA